MCQLWHRVEVQQQLPYTPRTSRIADQHVHTAEVILVKFASHLASNTKRMIGGYRLLEEVACRRHETLGFVLK